jgi:Uma2 family endonuclease
MSLLASSQPIPAPAVRPDAPEDVLRIRDRIMEWVDGRLVEKTMGAEASWIATRLARLLYPVSEGIGLGLIMQESFVQGFRAEPSRVRRPDILFARMGHFPGGVVPQGTLRFIPEFIVEVQSPNDEVDEVEARIDDYLDNGAQLVWLVMPGRRSIRAHRADDTIQRFRENDVITGEAVIPEFSARVGDLLRAPVVPTTPAAATPNPT